MATLLPPPNKKIKLPSQIAEPAIDLSSVRGNVVCRFQSSDGTEAGSHVTSEISIPINSSKIQLEALLNNLLENTGQAVPYTISIAVDDRKKEDTEEPATQRLIDIGKSLFEDVFTPGIRSSEQVLTLLYTPQAVFRVRSATRCSAAIPGHGGPILAVQFAPRGASRLATASGDGTARIWDCETQTPLYTLKGHSHWVLSLSWSSDGQYLATGSNDNTVRLWDAKTGEAAGLPLIGHKKWIIGLAWEPIHLIKGNVPPRLASSSKDATIKIWDVRFCRLLMTLGGHGGSVSCIKWGGKGWLYSGSQDRTIRIWDVNTGKLLHTLSGHAHWINTMSLSTDFALRTGAFDHTGSIPENLDIAKERAQKRYMEAYNGAGQSGERVVTGSDDFTMYLWDPENTLKYVARMTGTIKFGLPYAKASGHQRVVNHVTFSPDARMIASASFDNSVRLWDGKDGSPIATLRAHVAAVYQCSFSSDSRLLVSSSKDTTIKVWDLATKKLKNDLPGHDDEVFAVDWASDGQIIASGGRDKVAA